MTAGGRPAPGLDPPIPAAAPMAAITYALLAIAAADNGDAAGALAHLATAQRHSRATARRVRQVLEIAALVVAEHRERASGLALMHAAEFPADADTLAAITFPATRAGTPGGQRRR